MELITKLGVDWKLLLAQAVNFFILLFVLYKLVYKPVLDALEQRSKAIEKGVKDAHAAGEKLLEIERLREQRMSEAAREIGKLLDTAKHEAEEMKKGIMATAAAQSDDLLKRAKLQIAEEKEKMLVEVKQEVSALIIQTTSKMLGREFSGADQKRLSDAIVQEIKS